MAESVIIIVTVAIATKRSFKEFISSPSTCSAGHVRPREYYLPLVVPRTSGRYRHRFRYTSSSKNTDLVDIETAPAESRVHESAVSRATTFESREPISAQDGTGEFE
jgi:hypothetical protein